MNLDFTTIEKQAQLLKEEQEKLEQKDHDFQLALDKHREALKDLFKELFHDREIKTENEPYRVCRRVNILRDYPDDKIKIYP
ncbi:hypothetical protein WDA57_17795, partial [Acinetobacter nosocomialis]